ncbi:DUF3445 domain-containing protein [bacterium]|nr:DUF3445 domain-containing protein [bacterium]
MSVVLQELDLSERVAGLPEPADYFPIETGRYEVQAGLKILGKQPVQGRIETNFFLIDAQYHAYLRAKREARREDLSKYYRRHALSPALERAATAWLMQRLCIEYPDYFALETTPALVFTNRLIGLRVSIDPESLVVIDQAQGPSAHPGGEVFADVDFRGADALDVVTSCLQEDLALVAMDPEDRRDWLACLHLSYPNHWSPAEKIAQPFLAVHAPVADFERVARTSDKILEAMIHRGPFVRFAWGIATDTALNHHPENPPGRALPQNDPIVAGESTYMRIERQTLQGFPEHHAALFTIRTYFTPVRRIAADPERRAQLRDALATMSPEALAYKGLEAIQAPLVAYLR